MAAENKPTAGASSAPPESGDPPADSLLSEMGLPPDEHSPEEAARRILEAHADVFHRRPFEADEPDPGPEAVEELRRVLHRERLASEEHGDPPEPPAVYDPEDLEPEPTADEQVPRLLLTAKYGPASGPPHPDSGYSARARGGRFRHPRYALEHRQYGVRVRPLVEEEEWADLTDVPRRPAPRWIVTRSVEGEPARWPEGERASRQAYEALAGWAEDHFHPDRRRQILRALDDDRRAFAVAVRGVLPRAVSAALRRPASELPWSFQRAVEELVPERLFGSNKHAVLKAGTEDPAASLDAELEGDDDGENRLPAALEVERDEEFGAFEADVALRTLMDRAGLSDGERRALLLCELRGLDHEEAAEIMGSTRGSVKSLKSKARSKLRALGEERLLRYAGR